MPNYRTTVFLCLATFCLLFAETATAQTPSEAALLSVMRAKSESYYEANTKKWQTFWVQDSSSSRSVISKFGYSHQMGWPALITKLVKDSEEAGNYPVRVTYENVHIRQSPTLAFVETDERMNVPDVDSAYALTHTYTVLAYEENRWKIANQVRVAPGTYATTTDNREYELNSIGYELLTEKRVAEATDLFVLIVKLSPNSWNAYDSLGEAYALAGNTQLAIANYEKSLALNPKNEAGKAALARLKK